MRLPASGALRNYSVLARLEPPRALQPGRDDFFERERAVAGSFLVAAYRRPDFRVDATLTTTDRIAGAPLTGVTSVRYLFGAPMTGRPARWKVTRDPVYSPPPTVVHRYAAEEWAFVGLPSDGRPSATEDVAAADGKLDESGELSVSVLTPKGSGRPYRYTLESEVEDVSRQRIANRASVLVHPAPWYVGIRRPGYFVDARTPLETAVVAVTPGGEPVAGVSVAVKLQQVQWNSLRRAEGGGFYTWDTERRIVDAGEWKVTSAADPVPLAIPIPSGGSFLLTARAEDGEGRSTVTTVSFLRDGRWLHGVDAVRPLPHRPRTRAPQLQAWRDRPHPGQVPGSRRRPS